MSAEHKHLEKNGNLAFEVILNPASGNSPLRAISLQNSNRLSLSENDIKHKLHMADERRQSFEIQLLERLAHGREKAKGVLEKAALDNRHFAIATQAKLRRSMEVNKENRDGLIKALQERLKEHSNKVAETCRQSDRMVEEFQSKLTCKISQKYDDYASRKESHIQGMLKRLKEHAMHIRDVCQAGEKIGKVCEEKLVLKMENAIQNREEQLKTIQERLLEHERRIDEVQKKNIYISVDKNESGNA